MGKPDRDREIGLKLDRREFLVGCGALLTAAGAGACDEAQPAAPPSDAAPPPDGPPATTGLVVDVHDPQALDASLKYDETRIAAMLSAGLLELSHAANPIPTAMLGWLDEAARLGLGSRSPSVKELEIT